MYLGVAGRYDEGEAKMNHPNNVTVVLNWKHSLKEARGRCFANESECMFGMQMQTSFYTERILCLVCTANSIQWIFNPDTSMMVHTSDYS